jgi:hypothetical protein
MPNVNAMFEPQPMLYHPCTHNSADDSGCGHAAPLGMISHKRRSRRRHRRGDRSRQASSRPCVARHVEQVLDKATEGMHDCDVILLPIACEPT